MTGRRRPAPAVALALAVATVLAACTGADGRPAPDPVPDATATPSPSAQVRATDTTSPTAPFTLVAEATDVEASLRTSRELFAAAPVVVVAPSGQPAAQEVAARAAVELGVPLLVGPAPAPAAASTDGSAATPSAPPPDGSTEAADPALSGELDRLGATTVVAVGDVGGLGEGSAGGSADDGPEAGTPGRPEVRRAAASVAAVADATGLRLGAPASTDPSTFAAGVAALGPGTLTPAADLTLARDAPLDDVVALAVDTPEQLASIATARAAAVPVHLVPASAPNPQATASVVEALHTAARPRTLALGAAFAAEPALEWKVRSAATGVQLPAGGQLLFPRHQFVALYGTPATTTLGVLGEQDAAASVQRAREVAAGYTGLTDRTVVPMFEIIATVAAGSAGADGNFSNEQSVAALRPWVDAAAAAGVYVVLDLQPGRSDFLSQARQYEELLRLPHVGLALDPEWRLGPDEQPLQRIGSVDAAEVNEVGRWLADLTNAHALPPKIFLVHQFRLDMIGNRAALDTSRPELAVVLHADGQGSQPAKQATWRTLHGDAPAGVAWGWKNFLDEDLPVLTPEQTVRDVSPVPDLVTYQ
ncbi:hypothetical protein [Cellulomonas aerilata]|uniref:Lipoprotein n=1 Tax=Cellulomonas aerilata TaxID=515326 RepID=A0A512D7S0_9CELL|nr:hypothetical protein [Cellulomonas aerilata]GEO32511.1 hypothetical protein CAE01nite_02360 [Cellulomonas aerilata]